MITLPHATKKNHRTLIAGLIAALFLGLALGGGGVLRASAQALVLPAPAQDEKSDSNRNSEVAIFAGGCFWGVQGVFQHVNGVNNAVSGYTGGTAETAEYETVSTGTTGHAESVRIDFDPRKVSYGQLLQIFFSVAHDPTELNRQGPDTGTQYRSAIFPTSPEQSNVATAYIAQLNQSHLFKAQIVTKIEPDKHFFPAEDYHQDFLTTHPSYPYIVFNDLPKIEDLKVAFPDLYRAEPRLVSQAKATE